MATKFYFHRATTGVTGTLPATNVVLGASGNAATWTPGVTNGTATTPLLTNRVMDPTISTVAQTSLAYATGAVTTNQKQPLLRFISPPIQAQTFAAQLLQIYGGISCSNTASVFSYTFILGIWRPSTGAAIGAIYNGVGASNTTAATTSEANQGFAGVSSVVQTSLAGDVLVLEIWRTHIVQTMGTSYTNTYFYDGQTEQSASNNAAVLIFANNVTLMTDITEPVPALGGPVDSFEA